MIAVYTDGSCAPNPGPGGWAWITTDGRNGSGGCRRSSNNRMELQAVIEALKDVQGDLHIHSDSQLTIMCATRAWKRRKNLDLWGEFDRLAKDRTLAFTWVRGHSGDHYNELADELAAQARLSP